MQTVPNLVTVDIDPPHGNMSGVEDVVDGVLESLGSSGTRATFFVSRPVTDGNAALVRRIAEQQHELACLTTRQPSTSAPYCPKFVAELEAVRDAIEDATGLRVRGHRNASFAVNYESEWMYDVLVDRGFEYDSSRFPAKYVDFTWEPVPTSVHAVRRWGGTLLEIPVTTADVLAMRVQFGTAGSVRGVPLPLWSSVVQERQARGEPLVMHLRARELRRAFRLTAKSPVADRRALKRVGRIVTRFPFTSVANALPALLRSAPILES